jgi:hypothetical protein
MSFDCVDWNMTNIKDVVWNTYESQILGIIGPAKACDDVFWQCPYCKKWFYFSQVIYTQVWCSDCQDEHDGIMCPDCLESVFEWDGDRLGYKREWNPELDGKQCWDWVI